MLVPAQYSLTVQHRGLKYHSFILKSGKLDRIYPYKLPALTLCRFVASLFDVGECNQRRICFLMQLQMPGLDFGGSSEIMWDLDYILEAYLQAIFYGVLLYVLMYFLRASVAQWYRVGLLVNRSMGRSFTRGMIHNNFYLISLGCPWSSIAL